MVWAVSIDCLVWVVWKWAVGVGHVQNESTLFALLPHLNQELWSDLVWGKKKKQIKKNKQDSLHTCLITAKPVFAKLLSLVPTLLEKLQSDRVLIFLVPQTNT